MKAIYFGAGLDTRPLINLDDVKEFIYIDCQPYSEFGNIVNLMKNLYINYINYLFYL